LGLSQATQFSEAFGMGPLSIARPLLPAKMFKAFKLTGSLPRCAAVSPALVRYTSTANGVKPSIKLLAKLRQETEVSISKAKEALVKAENDYQKALAWLEEDAKVSGAKKAQKVAGRTAGEGLIAIATVEAPGRGEGGVKSRSTIIEVSLTHT
jgi:elongation factor Ts